ncbi:DUF1015 domain-containing protein [Echinicola soli]|uniref:DUF1015 domain-containing protein n=1 Tax=Echinicola soli TaxID=2591634 RepID=A0A514CMG5_9BACT|nr:DUF1015 domain-containing protein [Echinicola soli]QDH80947.1 DUF1015 domain-containing protein [Echinicola soli]
MADIIPFSAWRYSEKLRPKIANLTVPNLDGISKVQLDKRYQDPTNSIHLTLPAPPSEVEKKAVLLKNWKNNKVLKQDPAPAIYIYYQHFCLPGSTRRFCRKGFIAYIKAYHWEEKVILGHENTIPYALKEQVQLLSKTQIQPSPTHGLYEDPENSLVPLMDNYMNTPIFDFQNDLGIREQLAAVTDPEDIMQFVSHLKGQKIILADGHHRLQASIHHRDHCKENNDHHTGMEAYNYHMMNFTNVHSDHLKILPTHRLISNVTIPEALLLEKAAIFFTIQRISYPSKIEVLTISQPWTFILMFKEAAYKISLRIEKFDLFTTAIPDAVKRLDISVLHYFFVDHIIGIPMDEQRSSKQITYETDRLKCHGQLHSGKADLALLTREISIEEVMEVCHSGYTLPQKSTYFYPKASSGLLFGSIREDEFITYP